MSKLTNKQIKQVVVEFEKANGNGKAFAIAPNLWVTNFKELVDAIKANFSCVVYGAKGLDGNFYNIAINANRATLAEFNALVLKVAQFGEKPKKEAKVSTKKATSNKQAEEIADLKTQLATLIALMSKK